jgi:hypothetical protein
MENFDTIFVNKLKEQQIEINIDPKKKDKLIKFLFDKIEQTKIIKKNDIVEYFTDISEIDLAIFIKCFNIVNNLPHIHAEYRTWKKYEDHLQNDPYLIQCISLQSYRNGYTTPYTICEVKSSSIIFDTWRINCALKAVP